MMTPVHKLKLLTAKVLSELDGLAALASLPFRRRELEKTLAGRLTTINFETTNICNANCTFCAYQYQERPTGVMSMDLFRKVADEFAALGGGYVGLTPTVGEPLADPQLIERIRYLRQLPEVGTIAMYSNMILLQRVGVENLLNSGLSELIVSMSGFEDAMYRRIYRSKMYPKVIANVKAFARANNAAGRPVKFTLDLRVDKPLKDVLAAPDYAEVAELVSPSNILVKMRYDSWAGKISQSDLSGNMTLRSFAHLRRPRVTACVEMFSGPAVYWDGKVGACNCRDVDARELIIGDANRQTLGEIWFGEEIARLRRDFMTERTPDICKSCTHYNNLSIFLRHDRAELMEQAGTPAAASAPRQG